MLCSKWTQTKFKLRNNLIINFHTSTCLRKKMPGIQLIRFWSIKKFILLANLLNGRRESDLVANWKCQWYILGVMACWRFCFLLKVKCKRTKMGVWSILNILNDDLFCIFCNIQNDSRQSQMAFQPKTSGKLLAFMVWQQVVYCESLI